MKTPLTRHVFPSNITNIYVYVYMNYSTIVNDWLFCEINFWLLTLTLPPSITLYHSFAPTCPSSILIPFWSFSNLPPNGSLLFSDLPPPPPASTFHPKQPNKDALPIQAHCDDPIKTCKIDAYWPGLCLTATGLSRSVLLFHEYVGNMITRWRSTMNLSAVGESSGMRNIRIADMNWSP